ncbi:aminoacyl-histidine dipeptidase [Tissierella sp. MB52-C2]|uniref:aminoacyl-histidine dipeptidase n=1 Tax=Tissierella sp. MB52-C2 TaxID=3070999 RepID=UPI00280A9DAA|nr:aminoacyl-histidine dipeptidase [Tissierella sp. MB52-C2]WMM26468.1 aminoacyl-histidine dipeptidase [Tissierella sp. MB52-C2]
MTILEGLKPQRVMYYFEEMSKIPRCSYDEQRISDYLSNVGKALGLEVIQDKALNIIIRKPAYKGYENSPTVILQGHMDMVGEKTDSSNHDFSKDPIKLEVEGDYIIAKETTLGADNGIAVAMALAILESKDIPHPPLEVLITSNEESGMTGAAALDPENITGKILINIDSEEEGKILVSCAGGERNLITIPVEWNETLDDEDIYEIVVSGLKGGHSGMEIDKGRGNSNKIMGRVLERLNRSIDINLYHIEGGSKSNAIPRYAKAVISMEKANIEKANLSIKEIEKELRFELLSVDKDIELSFTKTKDKKDRAFSKETTKKIISFLMLFPNGVYTMSMDIEGLVESSNNLGVVKTTDDSVTMESAIRSSVGSLKTYIADQIRLLAENLGAEWESTSSYPAWEYSRESYIRDIFKDVYKEIYNKDINIDAIHAGLECGLFKEKFVNMDMVSFGPNIYGVHAPGEKLSISSTERSYNLLSKVLEKIH